MCIFVGQNSRIDQKDIYLIIVAITETFSPFHDQCFLDFFSSHLQNTSSGEKSWEVLLGHVISELSKGKIYEEGETEELAVVLANFWTIYPACPLEVFLPRCYNDFSLILLKTCNTTLFSRSKHIPLGHFACANLSFNNIRCGRCHVEKVIDKYFL